MDDDILVTTQTTYCLRVSIREPGSPTHRTTHEPIASRRRAEPSRAEPPPPEDSAERRQPRLVSRQAWSSRARLVRLWAALRAARLAACSLLARALCGESGSQARVSTRAGSMLSVLSRGCRRPLRTKTFDYANRAKRDEAWDLLVEYTREKIADADLHFVEEKKIIYRPHLENNCTALVISKEVERRRLKHSSLRYGTTACLFSGQIKNVRERPLVIWMSNLKMLALADYNQQL
ncbi:hypothetical protein PR048_022052 [Dryococelus australis]|uniref:Uncharacterized protein n=1 Tax=Dryococelus australis TaxID=614101 RepID=A0ABQ9H021_9NEOP|nr:hypothetical protein PR048_022052 [Dryococelus australis]